MGVLRQRAAEWGIRSDRIGVLGFSAGGHLVARVASHAGARTYERVDAADDQPSRPDFAVLIYPAYLTATNAAGGHDLTLPVGEHCPPTILIHAADDRISPINSIEWFRALRRAGVPAELHVFESGGHGFGMKRDAPFPVRTWPQRCADWLRHRGLAPLK